VGSILPWEDDVHPAVSTAELPEITSSMGGTHAQEDEAQQGRSTQPAASLKPQEVASADYWRMSLNNWLQVHGGARRLTWETRPTVRQNNSTWTAAALST
jgi:hypothetical protein